MIRIGHLYPEILSHYGDNGNVTVFQKRCLWRDIPFSTHRIGLGDEVDFTVPTGNFGNILAGYYAKCMGLPIRRLICASNSNNVLTDFIKTGEYNVKRDFITTISPSMDILVSSNLERFLYHVSGDPQCVKEYMAGLAEEGRYKFDYALEDFAAGFATEDETKEALKEVWRQGYMIDPHTAVAYHVHKAYKDNTIPNVIVGTANPYKFSADVYHALTGVNGGMDELFELTGVPVPEALAGLREKEIRHVTVCKKGDMLKALEGLGIFNKK
jgi:threonine synthase